VIPLESGQGVPPEAGDRFVGDLTRPEVIGHHRFWLSQSTKLFAFMVRVLSVSDPWAVFRFNRLSSVRSSLARPADAPIEPFVDGR
jgi:hypothetical protein